MMKAYRELNLLIKIIGGIALGILTGYLLGHVAEANKYVADGMLTGNGNAAVSFIRWIATVGNLLSGMLGFSIPIILIGFIAAGIAELGQKAGKLLGCTVGFAYISSVLAGLLAFVVGIVVLPIVLDGIGSTDFNLPGVEPIFTLEITPIMGSITALILAFVTGMTAAANPSGTLSSLLTDIRKMADFTITKIVIPLLPFLIFTVFVKFSYSEGIIDLLKVFGVVYLIIIVLHWIMIFIHYTVSGTVTGRNPFKTIKFMIPAYFTAVGTQSSAVTMPVTLECASKTDLDQEVRDFAIPLCANVHLPGSMITITMCSLAVAFIMGGGEMFSLGEYLPFVLTLAIAAVAAPGVPGGAIMVAAGFLTSMLGFNTEASALMVALYLAQDSFGTAGNVTTDSSIAALVEKVVKRK